MEQVLAILEQVRGIALSGFLVHVIWPALAFGLVAGAMAFIFAFVDQEGKSSNPKLASLGFGAFVFCLAFFGTALVQETNARIWNPSVAYDSWNDRPTFQRMVLMREDRSVGNVPDSVRYKWDVEPGKEIVKYLYHETVIMSVSPVTDNPKVRPVRYSVQVEVDYQNSEALQKYFDLLYGRKSIGLYTKSVLYNFNEAHSREIGELYNPLDEGQQVRFLNLVLEYVGPELAKGGLMITSASFQLE